MPQEITKQQLQDEVEIDNIISRIDYSIKNFEEVKRMLDAKQVLGVMKLIYMGQVTEMCRQILGSLKRVTADNGSKNESELLLTAIESLHEVRELIDIRTIKNGVEISSKIKDKLFRVATISELLK